MASDNSGGISVLDNCFLPYYHQGELPVVVHYLREICGFLQV